MRCAWSHWLPDASHYSSGFAATLARPDGSVSPRGGRHLRGQIVQGNDLPVTANLKNSFTDEPPDVGGNVRLAPGGHPAKSCRHRIGPVNVLSLSWPWVRVKSKNEQQAVSRATRSATVAP